MSDVTQILDAIDQGDPTAAEQLLPLVYDELRKLAAQKLAHEMPGQTLQATALVHEAYLRLVGDQGPNTKHQAPSAIDQPPIHWQSRGHFFAAAAEAMRRILVERARQRRSEKHGGKLQRLDFDAAQSVAEAPDDELLAVDEALDLLAAEDRVKAELVKLRCFAGLSHQEAAEALGISRTTADRYWAYAKSWLYCKLNEPES
jgi:RNA polymerase sigma factor (TIGR02999 family)